MDKPRDVLTREELDFLLAPVDVSPDPDTGSEENSADASWNVPDDAQDSMQDDEVEDRDLDLDEDLDEDDGERDDPEDADEDEPAPAHPGDSMSRAFSGTQAAAGCEGRTRDADRQSARTSGRQHGRRPDRQAGNADTRRQRDTQRNDSSRRKKHSQAAGPEADRHTHGRDTGTRVMAGYDSELAENPLLRAKAQFFAGLLEEAVCAATKAHVRAAPYTVQRACWEDVLQDMESPAFYALLRAGRADVLFGCDAVATQALADVSLGAGSLGGLGRFGSQRSSLSFFDRELVRRCLAQLPAMLARAFDLPSCTLSRILWYADDIFLTGPGEEVCVLTLTLDIDGHGGSCVLVLPKKAQASFGAA